MGLTSVFTPNRVYTSRQTIWNEDKWSGFPLVFNGLPLCCQKEVVYS
jgi:hypothetical protein